MNLPRPNLHTSALAAALLLAAPSACHADFTYGGTEFSWEWLADASRAIVVGKVTRCDEQGAYDLRVEQVIKRRDVVVEKQQLIRGAKLGRHYLYLGTNAIILREIGWPALSDSNTYPNDAEPRDRPWKPVSYRAKDWGAGDRCLVFFGRDLDSPLQIINLDKPTKIEAEFLAIDVAGQPVTGADDLIDRIRSRVARTVDGAGRPRVRSAAINYWPPRSVLDGDDYYYLLAPPDDPRLASLWHVGVNGEGAELNTDAIFYPAGEQLGDKEMAPLAAWYWWRSGRTDADFASDARQERDAAIRSMVGTRQLQENQERVRNKSVPRFLTGAYQRNQVYRRHRTNYRTYPLGWLCVMSYDGKYFAFVDGYTLQVLSVDPLTRTCGKQVLLRRDAHRARTYVEFSWDSRFVAYTTADGSVSLAALPSGDILWTAQAQTPLSPAGRVQVGARMEFSQDQRYLALQVQLRPANSSETPNVWARDRGSKAVHVWDVKTGKHRFTPYPQWDGMLRYIAFDPVNSDLIRVRQPLSGPDRQYTGLDEVWSISEGKRMKTLPEAAP